jgi:hypothetical protein
MEATVEQYITSVTPDAVAAMISPLNVTDASALAQMVAAIKQKLFTVATELVSSALKGGDRY